LPQVSAVAQECNGTARGCEFTVFFDDAGRVLEVVGGIANGRWDIALGLDNCSSTGESRESVGTEE
jgi:hypothetical protein